MRFWKKKTTYSISYTISLPAWLAGKADEKKSYDELTEAQKLNKEALEENEKKQKEVAAEMEAANEVLDKYRDEVGAVTGKNK